MNRAARPGRGLLAQAGAGGGALDRATRPGRGLLAHAGAVGWALDRAARRGRGLLAHAGVCRRRCYQKAKGRDVYPR